jgi:hypothetical protein
VKANNLRPLLQRPPAAESYCHFGVGPAARALAEARAAHTEACAMGPNVCEWCRPRRLERARCCRLRRLWGVPGGRAVLPLCGLRRSHRLRPVRRLLRRRVRPAAQSGVASNTRITCRLARTIELTQAAVPPARSHASERSARGAGCTSARASSGGSTNSTGPRTRCTRSSRSAGRLECAFQLACKGLSPPGVRDRLCSLTGLIKNPVPARWRPTCTSSSGRTRS